MATIIAPYASETGVSNRSASRLTVSGIIGPAKARVSHPGSALLRAVAARVLRVWSRRIGRTRLESAATAVSALSKCESKNGLKKMFVRLPVMFVVDSAFRKCSSRVGDVRRRFRFHHKPAIHRRQNCSIPFRLVELSSFVQQQVTEIHRTDAHRLSINQIQVDRGIANPLPCILRQTFVRSTNGQPMELCGCDAPHGAIFLNDEVPRRYTHVSSVPSDRSCLSPGLAEH